MAIRSETMTRSSRQTVELTAAIVSAYVSRHNPSPAQIPSLIADIFAALLVASKVTTQPKSHLPAVSIRDSIRPDYIVCLEDGKKFKSMRRHLYSDHGLSPVEYRAKWKLPDDYPMVAPVYSRTRSQLAKGSGLGRKTVGSEAVIRTQPSNH